MEQYVHFYLTTPYCGFDEDKYICFKQEQTKEHLNEYLDELVQDHTESLMYLATEDIDSDDYETLEDYDDAIEQAQEFFRSDCWCNFDIITKEEWQNNEGDYA
jgi:hypothetical protein